ncbi:MAG: hypothetical protein JO267_07930 [Alphaproteobacteria bacterium]|nr:hypothetical protein [Alphaproteobacteria bacterium]
MIHIDHVRWRLENFWGYGSLEAPVWFIGMEEGLSNGGEQFLTARFAATYTKVTADIRRDMSEVKDHMIWFEPQNAEPPYRIQTTIKYPIALYLYLRDGAEPTKRAISIFQGEQFGGAETCALELMPLPSNNTHATAWLYGDYASLKLGTRAQYLKAFKQVRVEKLRELVSHYRPKLLIFYSKTYLRDWERAAGTELKEVTKQMFFAQDDHTSYCVIPQGAAFGMSYVRLYEYAKIIQSKIVLNSEPGQPCGTEDVPQ